MKPQITPDGNVIMDVDINKDAVGSLTTAGLSPSTPSTCKTSVLVENGGTVVIGGIYTQDERNQVNKVPFFGDLPAVGPLFRNTFRAGQQDRAAGLPHAADHRRSAERALASTPTREKAGRCPAFFVGPGWRP